MKRSIARWIATLSTAAALGLPAMAEAQTPEPQTPPQQTPPQQAPPQDERPSQQPPAQSQPAEPAAVQPGAEQASSPEEHLKQAKAALDRIQSSSLTSETRTKLAELKRHMSALEREGEGSTASRGSEGAAASTNTKGKTPASTDREDARWGTQVAAMDKIFADLLGPDSSTGTKGITGTTPAPGAAGTTGSKAAATVALDEATRAVLTEVRSHIVAYAAAKSGTPAPKGDAAMASPKADTPATTPAEEPSAAAAAAAPAAEPAAAPSAEPAAAPSAEPAAARSAEPAAAPQQDPAAPSAAAGAPQQPADQEAARRHLLAARDALNQLTQLPAAAQLTGDTRQQVSQLIANFNELITTQSQWRASYAKVTSNLTALLGPDTKGADTATATGLPPAASESTAAPGAVGTSGVGATAEMDPSIRAKLVELRRNLTEFETALGGPEQ